MARKSTSELKFVSSSPMKLYYDEKVAISIAHNLVHHDRMKHVEVDSHFIKGKIDNGSVCIKYIPKREQTVDTLTTSLHKLSFKGLESKLGMINIYTLA